MDTQESWKRFTSNSAAANFMQEKPSLDDLQVAADAIPNRYLKKVASFLGARYDTDFRTFGIEKESVVLFDVLLSWYKGNGTWCSDHETIPVPVTYAILCQVIMKSGSKKGMEKLIDYMHAMHKKPALVVLKYIQQTFTDKRKKKLTLCLGVRAPGLSEDEKIEEWYKGHGNLHGRPVSVTYSILCTALKDSKCRTTSDKIKKFLTSFHQKPSLNVIKFVTKYLHLKSITDFATSLGVKHSKTTLPDVLKDWYNGKGTISGKPVPVTYSVLCRALEKSKCKDMYEEINRILFSLQDKPSKEVLKIIAGLVPMRQSVSISKHLGVKWEQNSTLDILKYWYKGKGILDGKPVPVTYLVLFKALEDSSNAGNFKLALVKLQNSLMSILENPSLATIKPCLLELRKYFGVWFSGHRESNISVNFKCWYDGNGDQLVSVTNSVMHKSLESEYVNHSEELNKGTSKKGQERCNSEVKRSFRSYQGHFVNKEGHIITVKDLKRFICEYCSAFAKDAVVSSCGHVFCKECTDFVLERPCTVQGCQHTITKVFISRSTRCFQQMYFFICKTCNRQFHLGELKDHGDICRNNTIEA